MCVCVCVCVRVYCYPLTDCFLASKLSSVARHARCFKLGSKLD